MSKRLKKLDLLNRPENELLRNIEIVRCEKDIIYWINNYCWTYDPRLDVKHIPMVLFPVQEEAIHFILEHSSKGEDWIIEKSRDMGVTWLCIYVATWKFLFEPGYQGAFGSRKEELVDKLGDTKSIFGKIRINLYKQPKFLLPKGFKRNKHDGYMKLLNPETDASITGEAGDNMGRGGRSTDYFVDEAAFIERAESVDSSLSATAKSRGYVSTPNGNGNLYFRKVHSGLIPVFSMHWKKDPRKNKLEIKKDDNGADVYVYPWYEKEKIRLFDPVIVAQELDIDYSASVEGLIIKDEWVVAATGFAEWLKHEKNIDIPVGGNECGYDVSEDGSNYNVASFRHGIKIYDIQSWNHMDTHMSALKISQLCNGRFVEYLSYDSVGVGAGITGSLNSSKEIKCKFIINPINVGGKVTNRRWYNDKRSKELFFNLKAEMWWIVRERLYKTYEYKMLGVEHKLEDLISLPPHKLLREQLTSVKCFKKDNGKIIIETKDQLKDRGIPSPDYAESLVLAFTPKKPRNDEVEIVSNSQYGI